MLRNLYPRRAAGGLLAIAAIAIAATTAVAQDLGIAAFFGKWQGHALSESDISADFQLTRRDIDVEIEASRSGFKLAWNTVQRQRGDRDKPTENLRSTSIDFRKARAGVWRDVQARDPLDAPQPYAWARNDGRTLVVTVLQIEPDGSDELQVYRRTLTGGLMELNFIRIVDGHQVRSARGRLGRVAD